MKYIQAGDEVSEYLEIAITLGYEDVFAHLVRKIIPRGPSSPGFPRVDGQSMDCVILSKQYLLPILLS